MRCDSYWNQYRRYHRYWNWRDLWNSYIHYKWVRLLRNWHRYWSRLLNSYDQRIWYLHYRYFYLRRLYFLWRRDKWPIVTRQRHVWYFNPRHFRDTKVEIW